MYFYLYIFIYMYIYLSPKSKYWANYSKSINLNLRSLHSRKNFLYSTKTTTIFFCIESNKNL